MRSQEQFAAWIGGVSRGAVGNWELGKEVGLENLKAIATKAGISLDWLAYGVGEDPFSGELSRDYSDPAAPDPIDPDWDERAAALLEGRVQFVGLVKGSIPEIPSSPGAGHGRYDDARAARIETGGIASGHPVVNEWLIPPSYVRNSLDAQPGGIVMMGVIGHSMVPLLEPGDKVLVDTSQDTWVGDAVYVIDDGDTVFQVKTLKKVTSSHPPRFRIVSEASPNDEVVRAVDEFRIVGRVVGRFTRM